MSEDVHIKKNQSQQKQNKTKQQKQQQDQKQKMVPLKPRKTFGIMCFPLEDDTSYYTEF